MLLVVNQQLHLADFIASLAKLRLDGGFRLKVFGHLLEQTLHLRHLPPRVRDFLVALLRLGLHGVVEPLLHSLEHLLALGQHRLQTRELGVHAGELGVVSLGSLFQLRGEIGDARFELSLGGAQRLLASELGLELAVLTLELLSQGGSLGAGLVNLQLQSRVHHGRGGFEGCGRGGELALARELGHLRVGALEGLEGCLLEPESLGELLDLGAQLGGVAARRPAGWIVFVHPPGPAPPAASAIFRAVVREPALLLAANALLLVCLDLLPQGRLQLGPHSLRSLGLALAALRVRPGVGNRLASPRGVILELLDALSRIRQGLGFLPAETFELLLALGERGFGLLREDPEALLARSLALHERVGEGGRLILSLGFGPRLRFSLGGDLRGGFQLANALAQVTLLLHPYLLRRPEPLLHLALLGLEPGHLVPPRGERSDFGFQRVALRFRLGGGQHAPAAVHEHAQARGHGQRGVRGGPRGGSVDVQARDDGRVGGLFPVGEHSADEPRQRGRGGDGAVARG